MSLRLRINLLISAVLALFTLALAVVAEEGYRNSIREEVVAATRVTLQMLDAALVQRRTDADQVVEYVRGLGRVRSNEIMVFARDGRLLYASPPPTYKAGRAAPEWFARLVDPGLRENWFDAGAVILRVVPDASRAVLDAWEDMVRLLWLGLGLFVVLNALVYWFVGRALRPVDRIASALAEAGRGGFHARLPAYRLPELDSIGRTFNEMVETLERSRSDNTRLEEDRRVAAAVRSRLEEERRWIARELHDELGQCLTAVRSIATSISNRTRDSSPEIHGSAQTIASVAGHAFDAVHGIVGRLRTGPPASGGLGRTLRELVDTWQSRHPEIEAHTTLSGDVDSVGDAAGLTAFRIVQECLTNVVKHAGATCVEVELSRDTAEGSDRLRIAVRDDGRGMDLDAGRERHGLTGMRERVEALGGMLELESEPGRGVRVTATLPGAAVEEKGDASWSA